MTTRSVGLKHLIFLCGFLTMNIANAEYIKINSVKQFNCIVNSRDNVLIVFERKTCPWCRKQIPIVKKFAEQHDIDVLDVDTEKFPKLTATWIQKSGVPTFVLTENNGDTITTFIDSGYRDLDGLIEMVYGEIEHE